MAKNTMLRGAMLVVAVAGLVMTMPRAAHATSFKVTICHRPPGNPANEQTISVGVAAVAAHFAQHDDSLGECGINE